MHTLVLSILLLGQVAAPPDPAQKQIEPIPDDPVEYALLVKQTRDLMKKLGADTFAERQAAYEELRQIGCRSMELIRDAGKSNDGEIRNRTRDLLREFEGNAVTVRDAVGNPIRNGKVTFYNSDHQKLDEYPINNCGQAQIKDFDRKRYLKENIYAVVRHPDYGIARLNFEFNPRYIMPRRLPGINPTPPKTLNVSMVHKDSIPYKRAIKGRVIDEAGKPLAGAIIECRYLRTPGHGLIQSNYSPARVLTDEDGTFAMYMDQTSVTNRANKTKLVPPNTSYSLIVSHSNQEFFSWMGDRNNTKPAKIVLRKGKRQFNVKLLDTDGNAIKDLSNLSLYFSKDQSQQRHGERYKLSGPQLASGKLLEGYYRGTWEQRPGSGRIPLEPVVINADSPDEITFRMQARRTVKGTIIDASTGKPIEGAFVSTLSSTSDSLIIHLTKDDWDLLDQQTADNFSKGALDLIRNIYGRDVKATRTDANGRFSVTEGQPNQMHSIVAFTRKHIPTTQSKYSVDKRKKDGKGEPELMLFPAAFVTVKSKAKKVSSYGEWVLLDDETSELLAKLKKLEKGINVQEPQDSMTVAGAEETRLFVPASIKMQIKLRPGGRMFSHATFPQTFQLKPGEELNLGEIEFQRRIPMTVRVVDENNNPVEGVPIRFEVKPRHFSIAVNTNVLGESEMMVDANSKSRVKASGIPYDNELGRADNLFVEFEVGEKADKPVILKLTNEQVKLIQNHESRLPRGAP